MSRTKSSLQQSYVSQRVDISSSIENDTLLTGLNTSILVVYFSLPTSLHFRSFVRFRHLYYALFYLFHF